MNPLFSFLRKQPNINVDPKKVADILTRGVEDVFVKESLEKKLLSGKQLRVKLGIDPTSAKIHLGRAITLRKLKAFQDLGHQIVLIVGDFTALVGDPSDKLDKRPMLTPEKIRENLRDYKKQIGKIIDVNRTEFVFNSKWLSKLGFAEIATLAESFSVQQMTARRNFKDRLDKGEEISLRELLYPLMQGYDSVAVKADIELGGFDQLFNLKAGRVIQKHYGQPEQDVLTTAMLEGTDGRKMSSSWGNVIAIVDSADEMFGKLMSVRDELVSKYFLLCTDLSESEITAGEAAIATGANPRDRKVQLAKAIVALYHDQGAADAAEQRFNNVFASGAMPDDAPTVSVAKGAVLADVLVAEKIVSSKSDWRRLVDGGGVHIVGADGPKDKITDYHFAVSTDIDLKIGARRFAKIRTK
ncbi:MAG: tyrosine--tRNA ligase [Patescibacteria group bacterium]